MEIETERLRLRLPVAGDAEAIVLAAGDMEVSRWLTHVPHPYGLEDAGDFIARVRGGALGRTLMIEDAEGLCGCVGLSSGLGYWLARPVWGRGYATEAARAMVALHFADPEAGVLVSNHFEGNSGSANVLLKLGFGYVTGGERRSFSMARNAEVPSRNMRLVPEQWHALNPWQIETERLEMRPLMPGDAPRLAEIAGAPEVAPMLLQVTVPWPEAEAARWIEASRWRGRLGFRLGVWREGFLIGVVSLGGMRGGVARCAYFIAPDMWGQGYASEAMTGLLHAAYARWPELDGIEADHFDDNPASGAVLRRLGFTRTGAGEGTSAARDSPHPITIYALDRAAFTARHG